MSPVSVSFLSFNPRLKERVLAARRVASGGLSTREWRRGIAPTLSELFVMVLEAAMWFWAHLRPRPDLVPGRRVVEQLSGPLCTFVDDSRAQALQPACAPHGDALPPCAAHAGPCARPRECTEKVHSGPAPSAPSAGKRALFLGTLVPL